MDLFYAYFKYTYDREHGYLVAFVNREVADEWWRMISTSPSLYSGIVKRMSPQLYIQNTHHSVHQFVLSSPNAIFPSANHFHEKMYITELDREDPVYGSIIKSPMTLPLVARTDHISGAWYFIRSKADHFSHWYLHTSGICAVCGDADCDAIHVSSEYRTRLCVRVRNNPEVPEDFVMIGKDEISIMAPKGYTVHVNDAGDLKATNGYQGETDLLFGDLKNRFLTRVERQVNGEVWEYVESVERGVGEIWELAE